MKRRPTRLRTTWIVKGLCVALVSSVFATLESAAAFAAPSFVQSSGSDDDSQDIYISQAFSTNNTAGNTIIVAFSWGGSDTATCSDTRGNTYANATFDYDSSNGQALGVCYASNIAAGANTVTVTRVGGGSVGYRRIIVHEYSGLLAASPVDDSATNIANGTTGTDNITSTSVTTTVNGGLIFGVVMDDDGTTGISAGTGFTQRHTVHRAWGNSDDLATQDLTQSSAGAVTSTQTFADPHRYLAQVVAFKPAPVSPANQLTSASVALGDSRPGSTSAYDLKASGVTTSQIRCIKVEFDTTADGSGGLPSGMSIASAALDGTSDYVPTPASWSATPNQGAGTISITNAGGETPSSASNRHVILTGIVNPSSAGTGYLLYSTFNNSDCSTSPFDATTVAFAWTGPTIVSVVVDPSFTFSVAGRATVCNGQSATNFQTGSSGTAVNLGHVSTSAVAGGAQDLSVSTNAANGFVVYLRTSGVTPDSLRDGGSGSIADVSGTRASPGAAPSAGTASFGYTSSDTSTSFTSNTWAKLTNTNDSVLIGAGGTASKSSCIGYEVAVGTTTPAGSYSTTVIYTAIPNF